MQTFFLFHQCNGNRHRQHLPPVRVALFAMIMGGARYWLLVTRYSLLVTRDFPTPRRAKHDTPRRSGALCHHNIAHQLIQLSCFTPIGLLCVNKNTAVIIGGWRLRTINRNSAVYLNISQHSNRRWRSIFKRLLSPALVIGQCGNKYNICGQNYKWLRKNPPWRDFLFTQTQFFNQCLVFRYVIFLDIRQ